MDNTEVIKAEIEQLLEPGFAIYNLDVIPGKREFKIKVFLDKLDDPYGTPNIDDCVKHSKAIRLKLFDLAQNKKLPEDFSLEVSSAGAERELKTVAEWERFRSLPLKVQYQKEDGTVQSLVLTFVEANDNSTQWEMVDTKFNRDQGLLNKKQKMPLTIEIDLQEIRYVRIYLNYNSDTGNERG